MNTFEKLRLERGLSQKKAAAQIGISRSYLSKIEDGHLPSVEVAAKVAAFYKIEVTAKADEDEAAPTETPAPARRRVRGRII